MTTRAFAGIIGIGFTVLSGSNAAAQTRSGSVPLTIQNNGAPVPGARVFLQLANRGKVAVGTTDAKGESTLALDIANLGKVRMQVHVDNCPTGSEVIIAEPGTTPDANRECSRRLAGFWTWGDKCLKLDLAKSGIGGCGLATLRNRALLVGGGAVAVGTGVAVTRNRPGTPDIPPSTPAPTSPPPPTPPPSAPDPNGTYVLEIFVLSDPGGHASFVLLQNLRMFLVQVAAARIAFIASPPWVNTEGTYNSSSGAFNTTGIGTVAGFSNVMVSFNGTLSFPSPGAKARITGQVSMGNRGELPGGQAIVYGLNGQQQ